MTKRSRVITVQLLIRLELTFGIYYGCLIKGNMNDVAVKLRVVNLELAEVDMLFVDRVNQSSLQRGCGQDTPPTAR